MRVIRVEALPEGSLEAAAEFHAKVLPKVMALLVPPPTGEGDHPQGGGGAPSANPDLRSSEQPPVPRHQAAHGPPPRAGEELALIFPTAPHDHRAWRLAVVQDLARSAAPKRVNGIVGEDEAAISCTVAWLEQAPGVTGQLLAVEPG